MTLSTFIIAAIFCTPVSAQEKKQIVQLAKLVIDFTQLENYKALLKEGIETAVSVEPGVLTLYTVTRPEKTIPTLVAILEINADTTAYKAHLQTPYFIKYKNTTKDVVKSLELVEAVPLVPGMKIK